MGFGVIFKTFCVPFCIILNLTFILEGIQAKTCMVALFLITKGVCETALMSNNRGLQPLTLSLL